MFIDWDEDKNKVGGGGMVPGPAIVFFLLVGDTLFSVALGIKLWGRWGGVGTTHCCQELGTPGLKKGRGEATNSRHSPFRVLL